MFLFNCKWKINAITWRERKIRICVFLYDVQVNSNHGVKDNNIFIWFPLTLQNQPTNLEAVVQWCSVKKVFLEVLQNSQENSCARVSFLIKLQTSGIQICWKGDSGVGIFCEVCESSKNTFSYKTPLIAAFEDCKTEKL